LETCAYLDESYEFIFDFELFFRFARSAKIKKIERTQAFYRIHADSKTSDWNKFLVELYRFSRPLWPRRSSPEVKHLLGDFVRSSWQRRRAGGGGLARWLQARQVTLAAWTGWGNPEAFGQPHTRRAAAAVKPRPAQPAACSRPIDRSGVIYRSAFCSFNW